MSNPVGGGNGCPGAWWRYYEEVEQGRASASSTPEPSDIFEEEEEERREKVEKVVQESLLCIMENDGKCSEEGGLPEGIELVPPWKATYRELLQRWKSGTVQNTPVETKPAESKPEDKPEDQPGPSPKS